MSNLLTGKLTRLIAFDPDKAGELVAKWNRDSEFSRLYDFPPVRPRDLKRTQERFREQASPLKPDTIPFHIETIENPQIIGECELEVVSRVHGWAEVAIGIGEREYWGKGYGSDAMGILLRFGFQELNLHRIALSAFEYNPRAIRSYEKVGFKREGQIRGHLKRGGARHNSVNLGILRSEWEALAGN
jgi:RimJ/RimL family protein N-acetyltransferase